MSENGNCDMNRKSRQKSQSKIAMKVENNFFSQLTVQM